MSTAGQRCRRGDVICSALSIALSVALYASTPTAHAQASAQTEAVRQYDIPAGSLSKALSAWGAQSGKQLVFPPDLVAEKTSKGVSGRYAASEALTRLLSGSGVSWEVMGDSTIVLKKAPAPAKVPAFKPEQRTEAKKTKEEATELETITVTGSHIRRTELEGPSPVIVISRQDLERSGRSTVAEALAQLPQNFASPVSAGFGDGTQAINLRGLGVDNTLVLVNGRRMAASGASSNSPFVDLNGIPLTAVERIEVLTDGASAIYGSDAVTGVVNIILKKDFTGSEVSFGLGASQEGGAGERQASFVTGWAKDGFSALFNGEYLRRDSLDASDRSFSSTDDLRARGGTDRRSSSATNPGNVFSLDGGNLPGLDAPFAAIPSGQDGRNLTPADFAATAGQLNRQSLIADTFHLIPQSERVGLSTKLSATLTPKLTAFAEASFTRNKTVAHRSSPTLTGLIVPETNPFNPFGEPVRVNWLAAELGPITRTSKTDSQRAVVGLEGKFGGSWLWETSVGYSRDEWDDGQAPFLRGASASSPIVIELLSRTDPATALNVFGGGGGTNNPEILAELGFGRTASNGVGKVLVAAGKADGVMLELAGRELRAAVGWEYREESVEFNSLVFDTDPRIPSSSGQFSENREVAAGFLELGLPLFGPEHGVPGLRALELQLAARFEHYSDFGNSLDPKVALRWQPTESLAVRGSLGTSFRAPSLRELFVDPSPITFTVADPRRNGESVAVDGFSGGNPALQPEESRSWNLGLVWDVPFLRGLSLTTDFWDLYQQERITVLTAAELVAAEAFFPERITRAEPTPEDIAAGLPGRLLAVDRTSLNASETRMRGVDVGIRYFADSASGRLDLRFNGAYIYRASRQLTPVAPVEQLAGTLSGSLLGEGTDRPLTKFRANLSLFWSRDAWEVGVTERYTGRAGDPFSTAHLEVDDHYETDVQITYAWPGDTGWLAGTRLSLGAENVFNQEPPFRDATFGFTTALHSPRQAFYYFRLTKAF